MARAGNFPMQSLFSEIERAQIETALGGSGLEQVATIAGYAKIDAHALRAQGGKSLSTRHRRAVEKVRGHANALRKALNDPCAEALVPHGIGLYVLTEFLEAVSLAAQSSLVMNAAKKGGAKKKGKPQEWADHRNKFLQIFMRVYSRATEKQDYLSTRFQVLAQLFLSKSFPTGSTTLRNVLKILARTQSGDE